MDKEIFFILIDFFNKPSIFKLQITEEPLGCVDQCPHIFYDYVNYN